MDNCQQRLEALVRARIAHLVIDSDWEYVKQHYPEMVEDTSSILEAYDALIWQDISTAPKDGTEFVACWPQQGNVKQLINWNTIHGYWQSKGKPELHMQAKLWMAIPKPPKL